MRSLAATLVQGTWGLARARAEARSLEGSPRAVGQLVSCLFGNAPELRKRAADVARRITERDPAPLASYAMELAGLLAAIDPAEARTRWHLGLVVARVAHTPEQRLRAARLMQLLADDASNVVRCSAIEGLAVLAAAESSLREIVADLVEQALRSGSKAEKCRAREAQSMLKGAGAWTADGGDGPPAAPKRNRMTRNTQPGFARSSAHRAY